MYGYIYKTINVLNGMIYIGQKSGTVKSYYLGSGKYILRAIKKYGKENFRLEILSFATTQAMLDGLEMKHIYEYRQVYGKEFMYNILDGGSDGQFKKGIIPKTCLKRGNIPWNKGLKCPNIAKSRKGFKMSEDQKEKLRNAHLGRKLSQESKLKCSLAKKGILKSIETRQRMSNATKGRMALPSEIDRINRYNEKRKALNNVV